MSAGTLGARSSVATTRVQVPRLPSRAMHRTRLAEDQLGRRPVTLICAAAGSGKTVLVAEWTRSAQRRGDSVAWLTLEPADDKPYEFWSAMLEAFRIGCHAEVVAELSSLSPPHDGFEPGFVATILNIIDHGRRPTWLVLDDIQWLNHPQVLAGIDYLLAHLPACLKVIMASRREPDLALSALRLRGDLQSVTGGDLAFTEPEARELFTTLDLEVTDEDLVRLLARTEGWAAGLRLAAVSLSRSADRRAFMINFEDDHRAVDDYLFAEVLRDLTPDLDQFLHDTCVPEQLPIALAAELSGRADAGQLLDHLYRSNTLVLQAGDTSGYRYHSLLREALRSSLHRRDVHAPLRQHAAAAGWFDRHGQPVNALVHASAGRDDALLLDLIGRHGLRLILSGQPARVLNIIDAASGIADRQPAAQIAALAALEVGDLVRADHWLGVLRQLPQPKTTRSIALRASAEVQRALSGGEVADAIRRTGILDLDDGDDEDVNLVVRAHRAPARMRHGDYAGAVADLRRALVLARAGHYDQVELSTLSQLAGMTGAMCDLVQSRRWAEEAISFATVRGWAASPRLAYAYLMAAWTAFQSGEVERQREFASLGIRALDGVNNVEVELGVRSMHALAVFESAVGDERRQAARHFHRLWSDPRAEQASPALTGHAVAEEVRLALAIGEFGWATEAVQRIKLRLPGSAEAAVVIAELLLGQGRTTQAIDALQPAVKGKLDVHLPTSLVIANVMLAFLEHQRGNVTRGLAALERALETAAPQNLQRPFIDAWPLIKPVINTHAGQFGTANDFVATLMDRERPEQEAADGEVLSPKQLELLRDLQAVLPVRELAAARGVSVNTTRTHLRAVYRKLGVSSRSGAIRVARDRGLL
ncbi:MAG TPA: AAA family ATPase [Microlunatus sp.]